MFVAIDGGAREETIAETLDFHLDYGAFHNLSCTIVPRNVPKYLADGATLMWDQLRRWEESQSLSKPGREDDHSVTGTMADL